MAWSFRLRGGAGRAVVVAFVAAWTLVAAGLRLYGLRSQVVIDDEWHAIVKLMSSGYANIASSFGYADHSIPLTLLYKAMAATIGLDELDMRALQVACGVALVPLGAWLAWRATREAAVAILFAAMLAASPFLVLYSRLARPYAITTLLVTAALALTWRWRTSRDSRTAAAFVLACAASAWLHPLTALFPAVAWAVIAVLDAIHREARRARLVLDLVLGFATAAAMLLPLIPPLVSDFASLWGKAGGQHADLFTLSRMLAIFMGGLREDLFAIALVLAAIGAVSMIRRDAALGAYLIAVGLAPGVVVALLGAAWSQQGHTFGRYMFPLQVIALFWASLGAITVVRTLVPRAPAWIPTFAAILLSVGYAVAVPTFRQVATLGAWYGHFYHHYDYDPRYNRAAAQYVDYGSPAFYQELARLPPRTVTVIEAPFNLEAGANPFAYFDVLSHQRAKAGMLTGVCLDPARRGELPRNDPRFRFRDFVFLADPAAVRATGAEYLVLHREQIDGHAFPESAQCIAALSRLYGPPVRVDARLAAWKLPAG